MLNIKVNRHRSTEDKHYQQFIVKPSKTVYVLITSFEES